MNRASLLLASFLIGAFLSRPSIVRADGVPWSYNTVGAVIYNSNNSSKTSSITFTGTAGFAQGDSGIVPFNITTDSTADLLSPDAFKKVQYELTLTLGDSQSLG